MRPCSFHSALFILTITPLAGLTSTAASVTVAEACSPLSVSTGVKVFAPPADSETFPTTGTIAIEWATETHGGEPSFFGEPVEIKLVRQVDAQPVAGDTIDGGQSLLFTPSEPLSPSSLYDAQVLDDAGQVMRAWSFTTAAEDAQPVIPTFEGVVDLNILQIPQRTYTNCSRQDAGECSPRRVHTGWSYPAKITMTITGVDDAGLGPSHYTYAVHQHDPRDGLDAMRTRHSIQILNDRSRAVTLYSDDLSNDEFCYSVTAVAIDEPETIIQSTRGIVCVPFEQGDVALQPDPDPNLARR